MNRYLDAVAERVVIFDSATGTNIQLRHLGPDDFGGAALEGCNEVLCATRPDVVADPHRSFLESGSELRFLRCRRADRYSTPTLVLRTELALAR